jgi:hypothetical protein
MPNRTIKVCGWGEGFSPASITAKLDGEIVFEGDVDLEDQTPTNQTQSTSPVLFSFDLPLESSGLVARPMEITVGKAPVRFGIIIANYTHLDLNGVTYEPDEELFVDAAVMSPMGVFDTRSNVHINGVLQPVDRSLGKGTWQWTVWPGQTFKHDITISDGIDPDAE